MADLNPYRSPALGSKPGGEFHPRFDAGKLTARYLQAFGVLSIVGIIVSLIFFDRLNLDISSLLAFWAARHLQKHSPTARNWVIAICALNLFFMALLLFLVVLNSFGLVSLSYRGPGEPDSWLFPIVFFIAMVVLISVPIWLLNTEEAKREFQ